MIDPKLIGKTYPPIKYVVGIEKIKEYARAIGERDPLCTDEAAAAAGPYGEIVAPPTFAVVYSKEQFMNMLLDKELDLNFMMLVHGEQDCTFLKPVKHGDVVYTDGKLVSAEARKANLVVKFELTSKVEGEPVSTSLFTIVIRGGAA